MILPLSMEPLHAFYQRLKEPSQDLLGRIMLGLMVLGESLVCAFWIWTFSGLGDGYAIMAAFPYFYLVFSYISLLAFYHFRRMQYFIFTQLVMLLVMPFFMQWVIGGFSASSGVAIWGVLAPVGALMILGTRQSTFWFLLFIGLMAFSWIGNDMFVGHALPVSKSLQVLFFMTNLCGVGAMLYLMMRYFESQKERLMRVLDQKNSELEIAQARSEKLLLNILPKSVAERLKDDTHGIADRYECVTILFADLVNFTQLSANMTPDSVVQLLGQVFSEFDTLTEKYGAEKIKTIGDAYMVVCGAPDARNDHAEVIALLALEMRNALQKLSSTMEEGLEMRVGINSGPVIAGVIGNKKFSYDLWGDAVNVASRMEHYGAPDEIHVSEATYKLLRDKFVFESRDPIPIKGIGMIQSYFLKHQLGDSE